MTRYSKTTLGFSLYIIVSASFMLQVRNALVARWTEANVAAAFSVLLLLVTASLAAVVVSRRLPLYRLGLLAVLLAAGYVYLTRLPYFVERTHVLSYGFLGFLASRDWRKQNARWPARLIAFSFLVVFVSVVDEVFQGILPYRVYDPRDILTNVASGFLGFAVALCVARPARASGASPGAS